MFGHRLKIFHKKLLKSLSEKEELKKKKKKNSEPMQTPENDVSLQDAVTCVK